MFDLDECASFFSHSGYCYSYCFKTDYMSCLRQFLYPSEEDLFKLVRFLVERLSESSVGVKLPDLKDVNSTRKIRVEGSTDNSEDWMEKADDRGLDHQQEKLKNLSLHNIGSELSDSNVEDTSFNRLLAAEGESERVAFQKVTPAKDQSSQVYTCVLLFFSF